MARVLVDGTQVTDLDAPLDLHEESEVDFIKLGPLGWRMEWR